MEGVVKLLGVAMICAICVVLVRSIGGMSDMVRAGSALLLSGAVVLFMSPVLELVLGLSEESGIGKYVNLMLKGICVAYLTHICASICRDAGEASIAGYAELIGKIEILIISLPLVEEIVQIARELIEIV